MVLYDALAKVRRLHVKPSTRASVKRDFSNSLRKLHCCLPVLLFLAACSSVGMPGEHASKIAEAPVAAAYLSLFGPASGTSGGGMGWSAGAATVVAPNIAVTCAHNIEMLRSYYTNVSNGIIGTVP